MIDVPAYWFVCPPRHFNRRIVNRFADWLAGESAAHETQARRVLADFGCEFQLETGSGLIQVAPTSL